MMRPTVGIATDGAHSTKERLTRYRAVDLSSGLELFNHSIGNKTNNIGEFLAIVEAVNISSDTPKHLALSTQIALPQSLGIVISKLFPILRRFHISYHVIPIQMYLYTSRVCY